MAKTAKLKNASKPSTKSRASRRATSPALENNLDKSLRNLPRPLSSSTPKALALQANGGITKKKSGKKVLKRRQKIRLEQGREKAEAVIGKFERKVERAERMKEGRKGRNADWDDLNEKLLGSAKRRNKSLHIHNDHEDDTAVDEAMQVTDTNTEPTAKVVLDINEAVLETEPTAAAPDSGARDVEDEIS